MTAVFKEIWRGGDARRRRRSKCRRRISCLFRSERTAVMADRPPRTTIGTVVGGVENRRSMRRAADIRRRKGVTVCVEHLTQALPVLSGCEYSFKWAGQGWRQARRINTTMI